MLTNIVKIRRHWFEYLKIHTHATENMTIPVIAYFINTLDSQSSGRGRGRPNYFKIGELF